MMNRLKTIFLLTFLECLTALAQQTIQLQGSWELATGDSAVYKDFVMLPGVVESSDKVWLKRGVYVPQDWKRQRVSLFLECPQAGMSVYVNGTLVERVTLMDAPLQFDVSDVIIAGQRNAIEICADQRQDRQNGMLGRMELRAQSRDLYIRQLHFRPYPFDGIIHMDLTIEGSELRYDNPFAEVLVQREGQDTATIYRAFFMLSGHHAVVDMPMGKEVSLWDEFHPSLYRIAITVGEDYYETTVGMRELSMDGNLLMINRRPLFLRGVVLDGASCTTNQQLSDEQAWRDVLQRYKQGGFNLVRFRSSCPPDAAFSVADRLGIYLQPGAASTIQAKRIIDAYGHHPSFLLMAVEDSVEEASERLEKLKEYDPSRIFCSPSSEGWIWDDGSPFNVKDLQSDYKKEIEHVLQAGDHTGFQVSASDWEKSNIPEREWKESCSPVVLMARFPKSDYTTADTLTVPLDAVNAYYGELRAARVAYFICNDSLKVLASGQLSVGDLPFGKNTDIGTVSFPLDSIPDSGKYSLYVTVSGIASNHWDFWVRREESPAGDGPSL